LKITSKNLFSLQCAVAVKVCYNPHYSVYVVITYTIPYRGTLPGYIRLPGNLSPGLLPPKEWPWERLSPQRMLLGVPGLTGP
jgi:hypothetical protein